MATGLGGGGVGGICNYNFAAPPMEKHQNTLEDWLTEDTVRRDGLEERQLSTRLFLTLSI